MRLIVKVIERSSIIAVIEVKEAVPERFQGKPLTANCH
jgi:hypothetical protein